MDDKERDQLRADLAESQAEVNRWRELIEIEHSLRMESEARRERAEGLIRSRIRSWSPMSGWMDAATAFLAETQDEPKETS